MSQRSVRVIVLCNAQYEYEHCCGNGICLSMRTPLEWSALITEALIHKQCRRVHVLLV